MPRRNSFVEPNTVRIPLADDDWIEVRERLTFGEQQALNSAGLTRVNASTAGAMGDELGMGIDMARWMVERLYVWLVDWSLVGAHDKPVALTRDAIKALDPDRAQEIQDAIDAHVRAMEEKKAIPTPNGKTRTSTP